MKKFKAITFFYNVYVYTCKYNMHTILNYTLIHTFVQTMQVNIEIQINYSQLVCS